MYAVRSRMARRGRTGRKTVTTKVARRRVQVHHHHPRRYAGVRGGPRVVRRGVTLTRHRKPRVNKTGRHHRFLGRKKHVGPRAAKGHALHRALKGRHGHRKFHGRKKSLHKRHMRKGLHRKFKGRHLTHKRHVRPGLHRHFKGRKTTHHRGHTRPHKPKAAPISSASYLSMF